MITIPDQSRFPGTGDKGNGIPDHSTRSSNG